MSDSLSSQPSTFTKEVVRYDNAFNRSVIKYSTIETRIVLIALSKISEQAGVKPNKVYFVGAYDLANFDMQLPNAYAALREAAKSLRVKPIQMREEDMIAKGLHIEGLAGNADGYVEFSLLKAVTYRKAEGRIGMIFNDLAIPFLLDLKRNYTQWCLVDLAGVKSAYGMRLYGILMQWKSTGKYIVTVAEFRRIMGVDGETHKRYANLKTRVINVAVAAINSASHAKLFIKEVDEEKVGHKVARLTFLFEIRKSPAAQAPLELEESIIDRKLTVEEATLTNKQIEMFADKLAKAPPFPLPELIEWCYRNEFAHRGFLNTSTRADLVNFFRRQLKRPEFVIAAYKPWLSKVGARLRRKGKNKG